MLNNRSIHVVIIEDDEVLLAMLLNRFNQKGFQTVGFTTGVAGRAHIKELQKIGKDVDILICDISLPDDNGYAIVESFAQLERLGKIFISNSGDTEHRIDGLLAGADDFMPKPIDPQELMLRVEALIKRLPRRPVPHQLQFLHFSYNPETRQLFERYSDKPINVLSNNEGQLLLHLISRQGKPVSRRLLATLMDKPEYNHLNSRALDILINRLRKKLHDNDNDIIVTSRTEGYLLVLE